MSTRKQQIVLGRETVVSVNKGTEETPNFVIVKCATDINYSSSKETLTVNCYDGQTVLPSGNTAVASITLNGVVKEYTSANQDANVSAREFEEWHQQDKRLEIMYARPHEGDTVRSGIAYVTDVSESGNSTDAQTYSVTLSFETQPTLSTVSS